MEIITFIAVLSIIYLILKYFTDLPFEYYFIIISFFFIFKYIIIEKKATESKSLSEESLKSYKTNSTFPVSYYNQN